MKIANKFSQTGVQDGSRSNLRYILFIDHVLAPDWLNSRLFTFASAHFVSFFLQLLYDNIRMPFADVFVCDIAYLTHDNHSSQKQNPHMSDTKEKSILTLASAASTGGTLFHPAASKVVYLYAKSKGFAADTVYC